MLTGDTIPSYASQYSTSSVNSQDSEASSSSCANQYGPIRVRVNRKPAPTLTTGRRSKHLMLFGEEAVKRDKRREKNRETARKLKEKRQIIEDELNQKIKDLEGEHSDLRGYLEQLRQMKQNLEEEVNNLLNDPLDDILANDKQHTILFFEQYSADFDAFNDRIENLINDRLNSSLLSLIDDQSSL